MHPSKTLVQTLNKAKKPSIEDARKYNESLISADQARDMFRVDNGLLVNKVMRGRRALPGAFAGSPDGNGYLVVKINCVKYRAHRLVWLITFGQWPGDQIDHINGVRNDNRIENLREVSAQDNQRNQHIRVDNKSGVPGVRFKDSSWSAEIKVGGKYIRLGRFKDFDSAVTARRSAEALYGFHPNHGATDYQRRTSYVRGAA